jgi:hypothetical protein
LDDQLLLFIWEDGGRHVDVGERLLLWSEDEKFQAKVCAPSVGVSGQLLPVLQEPLLFFCFVLSGLVRFQVLGLELRPYILSHSTSPILWWAFFEIGSLKLFARVDFKPRSSWSVSPEKLGLQVWATGAQVEPLLMYSHLQTVMKSYAAFVLWFWLKLNKNVF